MWPWRVVMPTQNLLRLLLLLMLMMRIVLATVCCRFGSWGLVIKLNFCSDFQHKVWSGVWRRSSGEILKLKFGQYFAADVWLRLQSWILVKILNLGLMLNRDSKIDVWSRFVWNLWYELNPRVRCAFGNVFLLSLMITDLIWEMTVSELQNIFSLQILKGHHSFVKAR